MRRPHRPHTTRPASSEGPCRTAPSVSARARLASKRARFCSYCAQVIEAGSRSLLEGRVSGGGGGGRTGLSGAGGFFRGWCRGGARGGEAGGGGRGPRRG